MSFWKKKKEEVQPIEVICNPTPVEVICNPTPVEVHQESSPTLYEVNTADGNIVLINLDRIDFIEKNLDGNATVHLGGRALDLEGNYEDIRKVLLNAANGKLIEEL